MSKTVTIQEKSPDIKSYLVLGFLSIVWGSSFILIKKSLIAFEPIDLAFLRIAISATAFLPILIYHWKQVDWFRWKLFLAVGMTGSGIPAFMYFIAQTNINSSVSGLLNSLTPIFTLLIGVVIFKNALAKNQLIGVTLGFIGAAILLLFTNESGQNKNLWYGLFVVVGTICYGLSGNLVKHYFQNTKSIIISSVSFVFIGIPATSYLLISGFFTSLEGTNEEMKAFGALLFLSLLGTVLASVIFYKLIQQTSAVFGSSVAYIMPLVAVIWGFFDGESLGIIIFVSLTLILYGVYLIRKK